MFEQQPMQGYQGWGVNSPYMTPAYMSNFRPRYERGEQGPNPYAENYSVGESLYRLGPGDMQYGADAYQTLGADYYNVTTGMGDAAAWGAQNVAMPAAAWYGTSKMMNAKMFGKGGLGGRVGRAGGRMAAGATSRVAGAGARRMGMGAVAGAAGRAGAGRALGMGAAAVGGFAGSMFLPLAAAQGVASLADSAVMDPYVATRRGMDAMKANTANQFVSGGGGSESGGFGLSAVRAQEISQSLTEAGQADFSMDAGQYNEIADNMMRAGMFSEIGDMDSTRIVDGVKKATSVLKLITRITGDPDIQNGIQMLAKLKAGGLDDINEMGRTLEQIKTSASSAGVSVQQLMDTVGNQGMVMAQQEGMRGVTGLTASADAYAGFENARKSGIISGAQMQALGGSEGMTQNLMSGAMQMMNSGMGRMVMQGGGQFGGSMVGNIGQWGDQFSQNPFQSQGDWFANQGTYKDQAMNDVGAQKIMLDSLKTMARTMGQDPNDGATLASLAQAQGISPQEFRSMAEADRATQDPLSRMRMMEGRSTAMAADTASERQQEGVGLIGVAGVGDVQLAYRNVKSTFMETVSRVTDSPTGAMARVADWWDKTMTGAKGMKTDAELGNIVEDEEGRQVKYNLEGRTLTDFGTDREGNKVTSLSQRTDSSQDKILAQINRVARAAPPEIKGRIDQAYKAIAAGDADTASKLLGEIDREFPGVLSGSELDIDQYDWEMMVKEKIETGQIQAIKTDQGSNRLKKKIEKQKERGIIVRDESDKRVESYSDIIDEAADKRENVSSALIKSVMKQESQGKANAGSGLADGLMQFTPDTGKDYGMQTLADRRDPVKSVEGGAKYLDRLITKYKRKGFNDRDATKLALAGYNAGPGWVDKAIKATGGSTNAEDVIKALKNDGRSTSNQKQTDDYVRKIMKDYDQRIESSEGEGLTIAKVTRAAADSTGAIVRDEQDKIIEESAENIDAAAQQSRRVSGALLRSVVKQDTATGDELSAQPEDVVIEAVAGVSDKEKFEKTVERYQYDGFGEEDAVKMALTEEKVGKEAMTKALAEADDITSADSVLAKVDREGMSKEVTREVDEFVTSQMEAYEEGGIQNIPEAAPETTIPAPTAPTAGQPVDPLAKVTPVTIETITKQEDIVEDKEQFEKSYEKYTEMGFEERDAVQMAVSEERYGKEAVAKAISDSGGSMNSSEILQNIDTTGMTKDEIAAADKAIGKATDAQEKGGIDAVREGLTEDEQGAFNSALESYKRRGFDEKDAMHMALAEKNLGSEVVEQAIEDNKGEFDAGKVLSKVYKQDEVTPEAMADNIKEMRAATETYDQAGLEAVQEGEMTVTETVTTGGEPIEPGATPPGPLAKVEKVTKEDLKDATKELDKSIRKYEDMGYSGRDAIMMAVAEYNTDSETVRQAIKESGDSKNPETVLSFMSKDQRDPATQDATENAIMQTMADYDQRIQSAAPVVKVGDEQVTSQDFTDRVTQLQTGTLAEDRKNLSAFFDEPGMDTEAVWEEFGLDPDEVRNMDKRERKKLLVGAAQKRVDVDKGDVEGVNDLLDRLEDRGIDRADAANYIEDSKTQEDELIKLINNGIGSVSEEVDRLATDIQTAETTKPPEAAAEVDKTNWDFLKDVGAATEANTKATDMLTEVMVKKYNQDKGIFGDKLTVDSLKPKATEDTVKKTKE